MASSGSGTDAVTYWKGYVAAINASSPQALAAAASALVGNEKEERERGVQLWLKGIPNELRAAVWLARVKECGAESGDYKYEFVGSGPALSDELREEISLQLDSYYFQNSADFQLADADLQKIKRVLVVHAAKNGRDSYLHGSAQLVSRLLVLLDRNEAHTFAVFNVLSDRLRTYLLRDEHLSLRNDILVIADVLSQSMPDLSRALNDNMFDVVDLVDIITVWFDSLFANHFSREAVTRIMDIVLFDGSAQVAGLMLGLLASFRASLISQHASTLFQFVTDIPTLTRPSHLDTALRFGYEHFRAKCTVPLTTRRQAAVQTGASSSAAGGLLKSPAPAPKINNLFGPSTPVGSSLAAIKERDSKIDTPTNGAGASGEGELTVLRRSKDWVRCLGSKRFARLMFVKDVGDPQRMVLPKEGVYFEDMEFDMKRNAGAGAGGSAAADEYHRRVTMADRGGAPASPPASNGGFGSTSGGTPRYVVGEFDVPVRGHSSTVAPPQFHAPPSSAPHHHHHTPGGGYNAPPGTQPHHQPSPGQHHQHTHQQTQQYLLSRTTMDLSNPDLHLYVAAQAAAAAAGHPTSIPSLSVLPHSHSKSDLLKHRPPSPTMAAHTVATANAANATTHNSLLSGGSLGTPLPVATPTHIHATANAAYIAQNAAAAGGKQQLLVVGGKSTTNLHADEDSDHRRLADTKKRLFADAITHVKDKQQQQQLQSRSPTNANTGTAAQPATTPATAAAAATPGSNDAHDQEIGHLTGLLESINRKLAEKHALVTALQAEVKKRDDLDATRRAELDDKQRTINALRAGAGSGGGSGSGSLTAPLIPGFDIKSLPSLPPLPPLLPSLGPGAGGSGAAVPLLPVLPLPPVSLTPAVVLSAPPVIPSDGIVRFSELHYHVRLPCLYHEGYLLKATELAIDQPMPPVASLNPLTHLHRRFFTLQGAFVTYFQSHVSKIAPTKDRSVDMRGRRIVVLPNKPATTAPTAAAAGAVPAAPSTDFGLQIQRIDSKRPALSEQCLYQLFARSAAERDVWVRVLTAATQLK